MATTERIASIGFPQGLGSFMFNILLTELFRVSKLDEVRGFEDVMVVVGPFYCFKRINSEIKNLCTTFVVNFKIIQITAKYFTK